MIVVRWALARPMTVLAAVLALLVAGWLSLRDLAVDLFPELDVPVIWVMQSYPGLTPEQIDGQIVYYYEYHFLYVTGIERVESQSIQGLGVLKLTFHPGTDPAQALAQTTAMAYRASNAMPPGTLPPFIVKVGAGSLPVAQLVFSSETKSEADIQDVALNKVRPMLATLPGVSAPPPSGGKVKMVVIDADPARLRAYGLSPDDLAEAVRRNNLTLPSGTLRIGDEAAMVRTDALVPSPEALGAVPLRVVDGRAVFLRDVASVGTGADVVVNVALADGRRTVFMPVTKRADASTLAVMDAVRAALPKMREAVPEDVTVALAFDQARFVSDAIHGLWLEGLLGAALTAGMVLWFLRDARAAAIVAFTIPLSVLGAVVLLRLLGQTLNLMTLGGLALSIGILVDEATVAIENVHRHLALGKEPRRAVVDAMAEVRLPQLLALLCVLAVFAPAFTVQGIARSLFPPLALAVGAAMTASYVLSSTVVPVLAAWLLRAHPAEPPHPDGRYLRLVAWITRRPRRVLALAALGTAPIALAPLLPTRLFPATDTGEFAVKLRAPDGLRLERTVELARDVDALVREVAGHEYVALTLANVGPPAWNLPVNAQYNDNTGPQDARVLVALDGPGRPAIDEVVPALRERLRAAHPEVDVSFEAGDVVSKVLNFGAAAELEVVVSAKTVAEAEAAARALRRAMADEDQLLDVQLPAALDYPTVDVAIDRQRAGEQGLTAERVARSLLAATASSVLTTPAFWVDPKTGTPFRVAVQLPAHRMTSEADLLGVPVSDGASLADVGTVTRGSAPGELTRANGRRTVSVLARAATEDLGRADAAVTRAVASIGALPRGVEVEVRGQVAEMRTTLASLRGGLALTVIAVFLLLAANFQSLRIAAAVVTVVPSVLVGVVLALAATGTSWNVQSLMGAVMAIGVSVANAVLLVTVAVERWRADAPDAVVDAARARVRPIVMTGLAMIAGMVPTALALAEGGDQTAPLGIAVIGGLLGSLGGTLLVLPAVLAWSNGRGARPASLLPPGEDA